MNRSRKCQINRTFFKFSGNHTVPQKENNKESSYFDKRKSKIRNNILRMMEGKSVEKKYAQDKYNTQYQYQGKVLASKNFTKCVTGDIKHNYERKEMMACCIFFSDSGDASDRGEKFACSTVFVGIK